MLVLILVHFLDWSRGFQAFQNYSTVFVQVVVVVVVVVVLVVVVGCFVFGVVVVVVMVDFPKFYKD